MLQGELEVRSEVGKGSTFRLSLPASSDGPATRASKHAEPSDVAHAAS
jgi:hypothetical protein